MDLFENFPGGSPTSQVSSFGGAGLFAGAPRQVLAVMSTTRRDSAFIG
jgi:hypothetical protein